MKQEAEKNQVLLAGLATAAMAVAVVGHMLAIDWVGRKLRDYFRPS